MGTKPVLYMPRYYCTIMERHLKGEDTIYKENAVVQYDDENNEYFYPGDKDNGYENMRNYLKWVQNNLEGIEDEELDRWYEPEAGDPNVFVEYKNFTWQRSKSNETVNDTRAGKGGFSFYYAIHVFDDPYSITLPDTGHENQDKEKRVNTIGLAPGQDKTLVVTNADLDDDGKLRIISAILADSTNKSKLYDTYWKNRKIKSKFPPIQKLKDSVNNETFFVNIVNIQQRYIF